MSQLPIQPDQNPYGHQEENPYEYEGSLPYIDYSKENPVSQTPRTRVPSAPPVTSPTAKVPVNQRRGTGWCGCLTLSIVFVIIVAYGVFHSSQMALTPTPSTGTVDLLTAVKQQLVSVSFTSTGGASGDVINITLHRLKAPADSDLTVTLPPGLILTNSDSSQQNMVLLWPTNIELPPQQTDVKAGATAYCIQLHNGNPTNGTSMTQSGQGSPDLVSLMKTEQSRNGSDSILVVQAAVWAITDNPTRDDLNQVGYQLSDQDLQSVRDLLRAAGLNPANYQLTA